MPGPMERESESETESRRKKGHGIKQYPISFSNKSFCCGMRYMYMRTALFVQKQNKKKTEYGWKAFQSAAVRAPMKCSDGFRLHTLFLIHRRKYWMALRAVFFVIVPSMLQVHYTHHFFLLHRFFFRSLYVFFSPTFLSFRFSFYLSCIASLLFHSNYGYLACLTTMITTKMLTIERWSPEKVTFALDVYVCVYVSLWILWICKSRLAVSFRNDALISFTKEADRERDSKREDRNNRTEQKIAKFEPNRAHDEAIVRSRAKLVPFLKWLNSNNASYRTCME